MVSARGRAGRTSRWQPRLPVVGDSRGSYYMQVPPLTHKTTQALLVGRSGVKLHGPASNTAGDWSAGPSTPLAKRT